MLLDEEFALIYHGHLSPSDAEGLTHLERRGLLERLVAQKKAEADAMRTSQQQTTPAAPPPSRLATGRRLARG